MEKQLRSLSGLAELNIAFDLVFHTISKCGGGKEM